MTIELPSGFTARPATAEDAEAVTAVVVASPRRTTRASRTSTWTTSSPTSPARRRPRAGLARRPPGRRGRRGDARRQRPVRRGSTCIRTSGPRHRHGDPPVGRARRPAPRRARRSRGTDDRRQPTRAAGCSSPTATAVLGVVDPGDPLRRGAGPAHAPRRGWSIRAFVPGEEETVHRLIEDAFSEWGAVTPNPFEEWRAWALGRKRFEPWMLPARGRRRSDRRRRLSHRLPRRHRVGAAARVRADHRGRGLARAILSDASGVPPTEARRTAGLSTDSRTGARSLYEHVGMRVRRSYTHTRRSSSNRSAVAAGFEPARELPPYTLSRRAPSAARAGHRGESTVAAIARRRDGNGRPEGRPTRAEATGFEPVRGGLGP